MFPYIPSTNHANLENGPITGIKSAGKLLSPAMLHTFEADLEACDKAVQQGDANKASILAQELEEFTRTHFRKTIFEYTLELVVALVMALIIASIVRQVWFELYEIPTGSMRPTFKEQDHLTVTKTAFGINMPFKTKHIYFDPAPCPTHQRRHLFSR